MKRIIVFSALLLSIVSCHKTPMPVDKDGEYLVYTSRSEKSDFSKYSFYHIPDSIFVIGQSSTPAYSCSSGAKEIIEQYKTMMDSCGYEYVPEKEAADLGIQLTYVVQTNGYVDYVTDPYWWLDYPGYWSPGYWGNWTGWDYGYPVIYRYSTNSLIAEIVDLTARQDNGSSVPVLWTCFVQGPKKGGYSDIAKLKAGIRQGFEQSRYLNKNAKEGAAGKVLQPVQSYEYQ